MNAYRARPNTIAWPPIIAAIAVIMSLLAELFYKLPFPDGPAYRSIGMLIVVFVIALDLWSIMTLRAAHTTVMPTRKSTNLVTSGPFRFSRNPIYVGNILLLLGLSLIFSNVWFVLFAMLAAFAIQKFAIDREELHLLALFGAEYEAYCRRVRRWI